MATESSEIKKLYHNQQHYYAGDRIDMLQYVPENAKRILDVGCAAGNFGALIKRNFENIEVWGIDINEESIEQAAGKIEKAIAGPISEVIDQLPDEGFDAIFFNDVLEHMPDPYSVLVAMKSKLAKDGIIATSIPNVRYFRNLTHVLFEKDWKYVDEGILDRTHLRFFTRKSILRMFDELGFEVISCNGIGNTKSKRPDLYNILSFGLLGRDIRFLQFVTVVKPRKEEA